MLIQKNKQKKNKIKFLYTLAVFLVFAIFASNRSAIASEALPNFIFQGYVDKANSGDASAQFSIGLLNEQGLAPKASIQKAIEWYERAAENGHIDAALKAAELLLADDHFIDSKSRAIKMLQIASKAGVYDATYTLAYMMETGAGIAKDTDAALKLYLSSANAGHVASMRQVGMIYWYGYVVDKDEVTAKNWLMRAAFLGDEVSANLIKKINSAVLE